MGLESRIMNHPHSHPTFSAPSPLSQWTPEDWLELQKQAVLCTLGLLPQEDPKVMGALRQIHQTVAQIIEIQKRLETQKETKRKLEADLKVELEKIQVQRGFTPNPSPSKSFLTLENLDWTQNDSAILEKIKSHVLAQAQSQMFPDQLTPILEWQSHCDLEIVTKCGRLLENSKDEFEELKLKYSKLISGHNPNLGKPNQDSGLWGSFWLGKTAHQKETLLQQFSQIRNSSKKIAFKVNQMRDQLVNKVTQICVCLDLVPKEAFQAVQPKANWYQWFKLIHSEQQIKQTLLAMKQQLLLIVNETQHHFNQLQKSHFVNQKPPNLPKIYSKENWNRKLSSVVHFALNDIIQDTWRLQMHQSYFNQQKDHLNKEFDHLISQLNVLKGEQYVSPKPPSEPEFAPLSVANKPRVRSLRDFGVR